MPGFSRGAGGGGGLMGTSGINHFRVSLNLIMKVRLSAKFFVMKIHMQTKLIFILEIRDSQNLAKLGLGGKPSLLVL